MRDQLINDAIERCNVVAAKYGEMPPFPSVRAQLGYLSDLVAGRATDKKRLKEIILGVQAAREIESLDEPLADLLYKISAEVDRMLRATD